MNNALFVPIILSKTGNMMTKTIVQSRVSEELKQDAETVLSAMGLTLSEAIRLFLHQTVSEHQLPFTPALRKPSEEFKEAITELDNGLGEHFDNIDDFEASWKKAL